MSETSTIMMTWTGLLIVNGLYLLLLGLHVRRAVKTAGLPAASPLMLIQFAASCWLLTVWATISPLFYLFWQGSSLSLGMSGDIEFLLLFMGIEFLFLWCLPMRLLRRKRPFRWMTWSMSSSPLVREIRAHMTVAEKVRFAGIGLLWMIGTFILPFYGVLFLIQGLFVRLFLNEGGIILILFVIQIACLPRWHRLQQRYLSSTIWARAQGILPEQIGMFPFRR